MGGKGFEKIVIWTLAFIFFGPMAVAYLTDSVDIIVVELTPYLGMAGAVFLAVLLVRMLFSRY